MLSPAKQKYFSSPMTRTNFVLQSWLNKFSASFLWFSLLFNFVFGSLFRFFVLNIHWFTSNLRPNFLSLTPFQLLTCLFSLAFFSLVQDIGQPECFLSEKDWPVSSPFYSYLRKSFQLSFN